MLALKIIMYLYSNSESCSFNFVFVFMCCIFAQYEFLNSRSFGFKKPYKKFPKIVLYYLLAPRTMEWAASDDNNFIYFIYDATVITLGLTSMVLIKIVALTSDNRHFGVNFYFDPYLWLNTTLITQKPSSEAFRRLELYWVKELGLR